jgi:hypothetical protein
VYSVYIVVCHVSHTDRNEAARILKLCYSVGALQDVVDNLLPDTDIFPASARFSFSMNQERSSLSSIMKDRSGL